MRLSDGMGVIIQEPTKDAVSLSAMSAAEKSLIFASSGWESTSVENDHVSVEREPKPDDTESRSVGREGIEGISVESGDAIIAGPAVSVE